MKRILSAALALLLATALPAQAADEPAGNVAKGKIEALRFLGGTWEGDGWIMIGPQRRNFKQREVVRAAAGGTVVLVDGVGLGADADNKGKVVHQAFAVVSWNQSSNAYRWQAFRADGASIEVVPQIGANQLVWEMSPTGDRKIRFTIKRDGDKWHETGESWTGDGKPVVFLDMTLRRVGDAGKP